MTHKENIKKFFFFFIQYYIVYLAWQAVDERKLILTKEKEEKLKPLSIY